MEREGEHSNIQITYDSIQISVADPDPLVRCMDPDTDPALDPDLDPSIIMQK
jgi:hypothetical protein